MPATPTSAIRVILARLFPDNLARRRHSGKTAVVDALKLVLLTQSNDFIRPADEDFYKPVDGEPVSEFKIDCTLTDFTPNEAKNFIEYLNFEKDGERLRYYLQLHYRAWREGHRIYNGPRDPDHG